MSLITFEIVKIRGDTKNKPLEVDCVLSDLGFTKPVTLNECTQYCRNGNELRRSSFDLTDDRFFEQVRLDLYTEYIPSQRLRLFDKYLIKIQDLIVFF